MCTLTFIPRAAGYLLGMNRDERREREIAQGPVADRKGTIEATFPRESGGGTWIASNSVGITFALLNRNAGPSTAIKSKTRGTLIPSLIYFAEPRGAADQISHTDLAGMLPFSLVGFFPGQQVVYEWEWDSAELSLRRFPWRMRHWFSSGLSDKMASRTRGLTCYQAWSRRDAGSEEWLRGLHASHSPAQGSFSICVHRPDANSVSYTEVVLEGNSLIMRYHSGHPCQALGRFDAEVVLHNSEPLHPRTRVVNQ